jgi:uncharacterized delta-60 repeat protein
MVTSALIGALVVAAVSPAGAAPGDRDPSFGGGSDAVVLAGDLDTRVTDVEVQSDGKALFALVTNDVTGGQARVARLTATGVLDPTFGTNGIALVASFPGGGVGDLAIAMTPNDTVVVGAFGLPTRRGAPTGAPVVRRLTASGAIDESFSPATDAVPAVKDIAVMSDGRVIVDAFEGLIALTPTGAIDTTFGTNGVVEFPDFRSSDDLALTTDDHIVVGMRAQTPIARGGGPSTAVIRRYTATGAVDTSLDGDGEAAIPGLASVTTHLVTANADGELLSATDYSGDDTIGVAKLTATGAPDVGFGEAGAITLQFAASEDARVVEVILDDDGDAYVIGNSFGVTGAATYVAKLTAAGPLDPTYGTNGLVELENVPVREGNTRGAPNGTLAAGAARDGDDRLVVATNVTGFGIVAYRLLGDEPLPVRRCNGREVTVDLSLGQEPTSGADVIRGTNGDDTINGRGGADVICGRGGNDTIIGGRGSDTIVGGRGNDTLNGGRGADTIVGGRGNDTLNGGPGDDTCRGGRGDNTLISC